MKIEVGDILVCLSRKIERKNWVIVELEDWHVTLVDAEALYKKNKGLGDYWRVSVTYLEDNFMQL